MKFSLLKFYKKWNFEYLFHRYKYLLILIIVTFALRFSGVFWGLPPFDTKLYHPDEPKIISGAFQFPQDIIQRTDLRYPTGLHYTLGIVAWPVKKFINASDYSSYSYSFVHLTGRLLSILFGTTTVLLVYILANRLYDKSHAIIASSIVSFSMFHVTNSAWATTDVTSSFFLTLFLLLLIPTIEKRSFRLAIFTGASMGMLTGIKYPGAIAVVGLFVYVFIYNRSKQKRNLFRQLLTLFTDKIIWVIGITALMVFLLTTPGIWLRFNAFLSSFQYERARIAQSQSPLYEFSVWKNLFMNLSKTMGLPLAIFACLGIYVNFARPGAFETATTALIIPFFVYFGDALKPRYIIMFIPVLALFATRSLLFFYPWKSHKVRVVNIVVILFVLLHAFSYTLSGVLSRYPDTRSIASQYISENIPAGSKVGIVYTSKEIGWETHNWRYPKIDFEKYEYVDFLEFPNYIVVSSYDAEEIKNTLQSDLLSEDFEYPTNLANQWYGNSPPSTDIFMFYNRLYFVYDSPYGLVKRFSPHNLITPIEFPPPVIEIFRLK